MGGGHYANVVRYNFASPSEAGGYLEFEICYNAMVQNLCLYFKKTPPFFSLLSILGLLVST